MTEVGFAFVPSIIFLVTLMCSAALLVGGAVALLRSRDGVIRAVGAGAVIAGGLVLLALGASIFFLGVHPLAFLPIIFFFLGVFALLVWIGSLVDCAMNEPSQGNDKIVWVIIIVFTHVLGALLYLLVRRPQRIAQTGR